MAYITKWAILSKCCILFHPTFGIELPGKADRNKMVTDQSNTGTYALTALFYRCKTNIILVYRLEQIVPTHPTNSL